MRLIHQAAAAALALGAAVSHPGATAHADELLVMPYSCRAVGGRPVLTPSVDESHRIIGARESQVFTACSPANPRQCRSWNVHRFDLDCGGGRVPWVAVVDAVAERANRRAWVEGGRLHLRMGPWWSMAPDDPCAGWRGGESRWNYDRLARYCAERRAMAPPPVVEMPTGFAPMLGIPGYFVGARGSAPGAIAGAGPAGAQQPGTRPLPDVARLEPPPGSDPRGYPRTDQAPPPWRSEPAPFGRADPMPPARPDLPPASASSEPPPQPRPSPPPATRVDPQPPAVRTEVAPAPRAEAPREVVVRDVTPKLPPAPQPAAAPPATSATGVVVPKIINRANSPPAEKAPLPSASEVAKAAPSSPQATQRVAIGTPPSPPPQEAVRQDSGPQAAAARRDSQTISVSLLSTPGAAATAAIAAFAGLTLALLAAFAWARHREQARLARTRPHDIGSVSLDGSGRPARRVPRLTFGRPRAPAPPPAGLAANAEVAYPVAAPAQGVPANWGDQMPRSRQEALQILGLGVSPNSSEAAIKKVIDGLRLSWHPDLAKSEPDRLMRELRLKQINAAWDLIRGKHVEA